MSISLNDMVNAIIETQDIENLRQLGTAVRMRIDQLQESGKLAFKVGSKVSFVGRGVPVIGIVTKINRKTITVKTSSSAWRVSPTLLKKVA
jgi:hypothetical protein